MQARLLVKGQVPIKSGGAVAFMDYDYIEFFKTDENFEKKIKIYFFSGISFKNFPIICVTTQAQRCNLKN